MRQTLDDLCRFVYGLITDRASTLRKECGARERTSHGQGRRPIIIVEEVNSSA
jgi:hypothetical protein